MSNHVSVSCDVKHCVIGIVNIITLVRRTQNTEWDDKYRRVKFDILTANLLH